MVTAAMMKNPTLIKMMTMTGAMKAQMKWVLGFKKQLENSRIVLGGHKVLQVNTLHCTDLE